MATTSSILWNPSKWMFISNLNLPKIFKLYLTESRFLSYSKIIFLTRGWVMNLSENKLQRGYKCCHIVLFSKGVHVWTSTMVILKCIFRIFLHNMVDYNINNSIGKKNSFFQLILCNSKIYLWQKNVRYYVLRNATYLENDWNDFKSLFVVFIKHCDSIWLE